jgi:hypothetical protein
LEAINVDQLSHGVLSQMNAEISKEMKGDCVFINSSMFPPLDDEFRIAIEDVKANSQSRHLVVILETNGGLMETVERLVEVMRAHYDEVSFVIPNFAYSAGTVLALSGDTIYMDYYSVLGPIDPQYRNNDGQYLPGHGVLAKYEELCKRVNSASSPDECRAELAYLIKNFDPAQLFQIEQAVQHGITLITEWLPKYKFKNWKKTKSRGKAVTPRMKKLRATRIAKTLGDASRWHSHGRGISMRDLNGSDVDLIIEDFATNPTLDQHIRNYHGLAVDYFGKLGWRAYLHTNIGPRRVG